VRTPLTKEERLVLELLVLGKRSEEIAGALDLPPQVVRNCTQTLITRVLEDLEPSSTPPAPVIALSEGQRGGAKRGSQANERSTESSSWRSSQPQYHQPSPS